MTTAPKRMRLAAIGLSAALSVGVLAPFVGTSSASAATSCSTAKASYNAADAKVKRDQAKFKKAKKKLRKHKRARKSVQVIKHDKRVVKRIQKHVRADKARRAAAANALRSCTNGGTGTPQGTANPLSSLLGQIGSALTSAGAPSQLTDALTALASQLDALPIPAGLSGSQYQQALTDAAAQIQAELQEALADPTSFTLQKLVDAILDPLTSALTTAGVPALPDVLSTVQDALDGILSQIPGLGSLIPNGTNPFAGLIS